MKKKNPKFFFHFAGVVTVWNSQKLRDMNQHILNISVTDGVFTAYTRLAVSITPVNSHSPTFKVAQYSTHIQENAAIKTTITQVSARDMDSGRYGDVTYHFIGDDAHKYFRINENTGKNDGNSLYYKSLLVVVKVSQAVWPKSSEF